MDAATHPVDEHGWLVPRSVMRGIVDGYSAYRQHGVAPLVHRGLPSPYLTLIFTFDVPLRVAAHPDPTQSPGCYRSLVGGASWREQLSALDAVLTAMLDRQARLPAPQVCRAWQLVVGSGGRLTVADLARDVGWSTRQLQSRFRTETGLTPREALRVTRFDRTRRRLRPSSGLAQAAAEGGYYDQAHLAREFRDLAGCSPSEWLATEFANVQARRATEAAQWGHEQ